MPFTPKNWVDGSAGGTPLSADALEDLEVRLSSYADQSVAAPHIELAPDKPYRADQILPTSNMNYLNRIIPKSDGIVTGVGFAMAIPAVSTSDGVIVGVYGIDPADGEAVQLTVTPSRANFLASTADYDTSNRFKHLSVAVPRLAVSKGVPYYAAIRCTQNGVVELVSALMGQDAHIDSGYSMAVPGMIGAFQGTGTMPTKFSNPSIANIIEETPLLYLDYRRRIVAMGDSITQPSTVNASWPRSLMSRLGPYALVINKGVGGETLLQMQARATVDFTNERPQDVWILGGINDIQAAITLSVVKSRYTTLYNSARSAVGSTGRVVGMTVLPYGAYSGWAAGTGSGGTETHELCRLAFNTWLLQNSLGLDVVIDAEATMSSGVNASGAPNLIDSTDGIHPNSVGQGLISTLMFTQGYSSLKVQRPIAV